MNGPIPFAEFAERVAAEGYDMADDATAVVLSSYLVGGDVDDVTAYTGLDPDVVATMGARLKAQGIWSEDGKVRIEGDEPDAIEITLQILCAQGLLELVPDDE